MFKILKYPTLLIFLSIIFTSQAQQNIWEPAGNFTSGRVWSMSTDQSGRVYASSDRLLYRTIDLGDTWELIGDFSPWATDIYDIEINSIGHIFLASSNTVGAFRSTDDGETWEELSNDLIPSTYEISINPNNDDLFAATDSGFFISTDNGNRWFERSEGLPTNRSVTTILFTQNGDLFAGTFGEGIYRSTDYGLSWVEKREGLLNWFMLEIVEGSNNVLFTSHEGGAPYRSTDNGDRWVYMNNGLPGVAVLWAILPISSSRIFIAGEHIAVYTSYDGSLTWSEFSSGMNTPHALSLTITKNDILFAGTFDNGVFRTKQKVTSLDDEFINSSYYYLSQNYPNPFNPSTTIKYQLPNSGIITLKVYDILGREVTTLVNEFKSAGNYEISFNAQNLASGVYIYRITASNNGRILFADSKQMILLR